MANGWAAGDDGTPCRRGDTGPPTSSSTPATSLSQCRTASPVVAQGGHARGAGVSHVVSAHHHPHAWPLPSPWDGKDGDDIESGSTALCPFRVASRVGRDGGGRNPPQTSPTPQRERWSGSRAGGVVLASTLLLFVPLVRDFRLCILLFYLPLLLRLGICGGGRTSSKSFGTPHFRLWQWWWRRRRAGGTAIDGGRGASSASSSFPPPLAGTAGTLDVPPHWASTTFSLRRVHSWEGLLAPLHPVLLVFAAPVSFLHKFVVLRVV